MEADMLLGASSLLEIWVGVGTDRDHPLGSEMERKPKADHMDYINLTWNHEPTHPEDGGGVGEVKLAENNYDTF